MTSGRTLDVGELEGFRRAQRLAYRCMTETQLLLQPGMTERRAAALLRAQLAAAGVRHYFHTPYAWFGDRTELADDWPDSGFAPSERALEPGMPVILDVAPLVDGYAGDAAYSFSFGVNPFFDRMLADLEVYRTLIPEAIRSGCTLQQTYQRVESIIAQQGYRNRHHVYPFGVIGHRVARFSPGAGDEVVGGGFGESTIRFFQDVRQLARTYPASSPFWNGDDESNHRATPGVWAVEPHIGKDGAGAKWEELLVVTEHDAFWLDDDLPHVRRWRQGRASGPDAHDEGRS